VIPLQLNFAKVKREFWKSDLKCNIKWTQTTRNFRSRLVFVFRIS